MIPIENRAYANGYAAGKRRKQKEINAAVARKEEQVFWDKCFVAAVPVCMTATGWTHGDTPIITIKDRNKLARDFADDAVLHRRRRQATA